MSGHSKFANIKHKKEKNDAVRGKIFTKIGRELAVAVKEGGGPDPANNSRLRDVIAKAKANNMPNDNIERSIKKAAGDADASNYEHVTYEGYGPNGTAIIVDALTDNKNRTASNVRNAFTKGSGNVGTPGCVSFMFDKKGQIIVAKEECEMDADDLMMTALDAGAEDFVEEEDSFEILTDPDDFSDSNPPEIEVTLVVADEDRWYFAGASSDAFRLNLAASSKNRYDKVQFISAKRSEKNAMLTLRVKLIYDKKSKLDNRSAISLAQNDVASPAGFGWDSAHPGTASWNAEESARYYQIQLVRNGIDTGIMRSVYKNHYDFSSQMTEPGEYCFRVRTVRQSSHNKSEWVTSEIWTVAAEENEENRSDVVNAGTE